MTDFPPPDRTITPSVGGVLHPVTAGSERARALARRSRQVQAAKKLAQHANVETLTAHLRQIVADYPRDQLGPIAAAAAMDAIARVSRGEIRLRSADVANWVRTLVDVARLESGQPTATSVVAHLSHEEVIERVRTLQASARAALARTGRPPPDASSDKSDEEPDPGEDSASTS